MSAAYDTYDYPSYWEGREYEHEAESYAIKSLLASVPKIKKILEIGAGYGRLTPLYISRADKIILSDPSLKLLRLARKKYAFKNIKFIHSTLEKLYKKIKRNSIDMVIMVRVIHHVNDVNFALSQVSRLLKHNGYFILEFPNKSHGKNTIKEFLKGNFTFPIDIFPDDLRSPKSIKQKSLPFMNYHPDIVKQNLISNGFKIIKVKSVSNIRSQSIKKLVSTDVLMAIEKNIQDILAPLNFGPSIFILAKKIK